MHSFKLLTKQLPLAPLLLLVVLLSMAARSAAGQEEAQAQAQLQAREGKTATEQHARCTSSEQCSRVGLPAAAGQLHDDATSPVALVPATEPATLEGSGDSATPSQQQQQQPPQPQQPQQKQQQQNPNDEPQTYGVIVDCGSSGTRAHIYQWDTELDYPELLHDIAPMRDAKGKPVSKKFTPGLSSLADKSTKEAQAYIKQVADYIATMVPSDRHANTAIYMLATAGMRLLDEEDQERIMTDIKEYVRDHYDFADVKTSVIPGSYEGMYQWISLNAKAKRFLGQQTSGRTKTYAVIEMGGASVQVTYQLRKGMSNIVASPLAAELRPTYLAQRVEPAISRHDKPENTYLLHSTTFLGFGSNSAREAYLDLLIKKHYSPDYMKKFLAWSKNWFAGCFGGGAGGSSGGGGGAKNSSKGNRDMLTIKDPCAPKGYVTEEIRKPRRMLDVQDQTIGFIAEDDEPTFSLRVKGTGQYSKCKRYVEEMLRVAKEEKLNCKPEDPDSCTMTLLGEPFIPFYSLDILGIGDIYYTMNTMLEASGTYDHDSVAAKTKSICQTPYQRLMAKYPQVAGNPKLADRIEGECFKAVWVDTLLIKGLSMPQHFKMLKTIGQINGDDLEWTLGAVLDKSLAIEAATEGGLDGESDGVRRLEAVSESSHTGAAEARISAASEEPVDSQSGHTPTGSPSLTLEESGESEGDEGGAVAV